MASSTRSVVDVGQLTREQCEQFLHQYNDPSAILINPVTGAQLRNRTSARAVTIRTACQEMLQLPRPPVPMTRAQWNMFLDHPGLNPLLTQRMAFTSDDDRYSIGTIGRFYYPLQTSNVSFRGNTLTAEQVAQFIYEYAKNEYFDVHAAVYTDLFNAGVKTHNDKRALNMVVQVYYPKSWVEVYRKAGASHRRMPRYQSPPQDTLDDVVKVFEDHPNFKLLPRQPDALLTAPPAPLTRDQCLRLIQNPTRNPINGQPFNRLYVEGAFGVLCRYYYPDVMAHIVVHGQQLSHTDVAEFVYDTEREAFHTSFRARTFPFIQNAQDKTRLKNLISIYYSDRWREQYRLAGMGGVPMPRVIPPPAVTLHDVLDVFANVPEFHNAHVTVEQHLARRFDALALPVSRVEQRAPPPSSPLSIDICRRFWKDPTVDPYHRPDRKTTPSERLAIAAVCKHYYAPHPIHIADTELSPQDVATFLHFYKAHPTVSALVKKYPFIADTHVLGQLLDKIELHYPVKWIKHFYTSASQVPSFVDPRDVRDPIDVWQLILENQDMLHYVPNTVKKYSSDSVKHIVSECDDMFQGMLHEPFERHVRNMLHICNDFHATCSIDKIQEVRSILKKVKFTPPPFNGKLVISTPKKAFSAILHREALSLLHMSMDELVQKIEYAGQEGTGSGMIRDVIQNCFDEILRDKFFVPVYEGSNRYVINPDMTPQRASSLGYPVNNENDLCGVYHYIGSLFKFCILQDLPVPIYLARVIVASILYNEKNVTPEMYVYFYFMDGDPDVVQSMSYFMRHPETIKPSVLKMNDFYHLVDDNPDLTESNYFDFLARMSKHKFLKQLHKESPDTSVYLKAFITGMETRLIKMINTLQVTVPEFEKLSFGEEVTFKNIKKWIQQSSINYVSESKKERAVIKYFKEILADLGKSFPIDVMRKTLMSKGELDAELIQKGSKSSASSKGSNEPLPVWKPYTRSKKKAFMEFFVRLMKFWTGFRRINMQSTHMVMFEQDKGYPTSHTCFLQLCLPRNARNTKDLYERLVVAVFGVEEGIGKY